MTIDLRDQLETTLGDAYCVERELHGGAMSRVFVADETRFGRKVVIKVLAPEYAAGLNAERFQREILLAARMQHPHIVPVLSAGEIDPPGGDEPPLPYFTMPYVAGESLRDRLARTGPLAPREAARILSDVADALAFAHARGVVHRDIKPANILLTGDDVTATGAPRSTAGTHALVVDFGVAKALAGASITHGPITGPTSPGVAIGTFAYIAPEQAAADPSADHRADIYAFGCVAYEMLAGEPPFAGRPPHTVLAAHISEEPTPLAEAAPGAPAALSALVMRCLAKDPADRPQSAAELRDALEAFATTGSSEAIATRARRRRRRWSVVAAAALAVVVLVAAALTVVPRALLARTITLLTRPSPKLEPRRVVVAPFENQTRDSTLDALGDLAADWIAQGLAGRAALEVVDARTAILASRIVQGTPHLLRTADRVRAIAEETGAALALSGRYYRDGDTLRFQAQLIDVATGRLRRTIDPVSGPVSMSTDVVRRLRERALIALATVVDTINSGWASSASIPPSYEAYKEVTRAFEAYFRHDAGVVDHLTRAHALDTNYVWPVVGLVYYYTDWDEEVVPALWHTADSLARYAAARRDRLSAGENAILDYSVAKLHGDAPGKLRAAFEAARLFPGGGEIQLLAGTAANSQIRPQAALTVLRTVDPNRGLNLVSDRYWMVLTQALHMAREYGPELDSTRRARRRFPDSEQLVPIEIRALSALGRVDDLRSLLAHDPIMSGSDTTRFASELAAIEHLRAHGFEAAARTLLADLLARQRAAPLDTSSVERVRLLGRLLIQSDQWADAGRLYASLLARDSSSLTAWGMSGIAAARLGDRARAELSVKRLTAVDPFVAGDAMLWRAQIAAALGDRDGAVLLVRQAMATGRVYGPDVHAMPGFVRWLVDFPPFQQLVRPVG